MQQPILNSLGVNQQLIGKWLILRKLVLNVAMELCNYVIHQPSSHDLVASLSQMHPIPTHVLIRIRAKLSSFITTHYRHIVIVSASNPATSPFRIKPYIHQTNSMLWFLTMYMLNRYARLTIFMLYIELSMYREIWHIGAEIDRHCSNRHIW